jgi:hypothetical protein
MTSAMQPPLAGDPAATGGMGGMEEATDTVVVPSLVDVKTLTEFCQAIQQYADDSGFHEQAEEKLQGLRARLDKLQMLAQLCRFAILGLPMACERLRDELECVAADFPSDPILCETPCGCPQQMPDDYKGPAQLSAALDLFAGAAFVSKGNRAQRDRFIVGVVRAIEDAICYPLAYAAEAAEFLSGSPSKYPRAQVKAVIATATTRFLEGDLACDPKIPERVRMRLERLACEWMHANPVTDLFCALTGPKWEGALNSIQPKAAKVGDEITLGLCTSCASAPSDMSVNATAGVAAAANTNNAGKGSAPEELKVLFCPRQPAKILRYSVDQLVVAVPVGARSGPIAIVRDFGATWLGDIIYLLKRYECEYPVEWSYSLFTLIPMWQWAYPVAFGAPYIEIAFVPQQATIQAYSKYGRLGTSDTVPVNQLVTIYYQVDPPGSDQQIPVQITASTGTLSDIGISGAIGFTASTPGDASIKLSWGALTSTIVVHVVRATA